MRKRARKKFPHLATLPVLILVLASVSSMGTIRPFISEPIVSAERAYADGNQHFDAAHPEEYDLVEAEKAYKEAISHNIEHAGAYHQLARIAFLRGEFPRALALINTAIATGGETPIRSSYYIRALIKGYMGDFDGSAADYREYLRLDSTNWAAANDLAWVLLKSGKYEEALREVDAALAFHPDNPWLLNSKATALYELGMVRGAHIFAEAAARSVLYIDEGDWSRAYPGNDPLIAAEGVASFQAAVFDNLHMISDALRVSPSHGDEDEDTKGEE